MKTFKALISEIKSALNLPPEARGVVKDLLISKDDPTNVKKILDLFRKYNPKKSSDKLKWKPVTKAGSTK